MSASKAILHTLSSRFVGAALNLLLLWFTSRWMGAGVRGEISLYFSSIYLLVLVSGFAGGSTLIYLAPRFSLNRLLMLAYGWCLGVSLLLVPALAWWPGLPAPQLGWWMVSSLLFNLTAANRYVLLGEGRIQTDNLLGIGVNAIQFLLLLALVLGTASRSLQAFVWAFVGAWGAAWLISLVLLMRAERQSSKETAWRPLLKAAFGLGFLAQITNLAQFIAYRIQFYLIDVAAGKEAVGVFFNRRFTGRSRLDDYAKHFAGTIEPHCAERRQSSCCPMEFALVQNQHIAQCFGVGRVAPAAKGRIYVDFWQRFRSNPLRTSGFGTGCFGLGRLQHPGALFRWHGPIAHQFGIIGVEFRSSSHN